MPRVIAVGLGPAGPEHLTAAARARIEGATTARLRTSRHPAAAAFPGVVSFDERYEAATDFDSLYAQIAEELVALAAADPTGTVVYAVPGSPVVAERTVEILRAREDVELVLEPAVSFVDLACGALGIDPIAAGLRLADAHDATERLRGPGPVLVAQTHSPAVLADLSLRLELDLLDEVLEAVVLHHLGLPDEAVVTLPAARLCEFADADHLTSVYFATLRTAGPAIEDLVDLMARLRQDCPWDRVQTHASLARHLLEESYEALEALESLSRALDAEAGGGDGGSGAADLAAAHVQEELGDLLFQVLFHAHLGQEEGLFDLRSVADAVRVKLVGRHPHVFADAVAATPDAVAARWEDLKRLEKGRDSVMDGIPETLPALSLMAKVRRKSLSAGIPMPTRAQLDATLRDALAALPAPEQLPEDASIGEDPAATAAIGDALGVLCDLARLCGVDPEHALRARAGALSAQVRAAERHAGA